MTSYSPLRMHDPEQHEDSEDAILLTDKHVTFEPLDADPSSKWSTLAVLGLSIFALACACASYFASASIYERRDAHGLRQPDQYPGIKTNRKAVGQEAPKIYFPFSIVRANKALPNQIYTSGSHVTLSETDSMFLQFDMPTSKYTYCYVDTIVPTPEKGLAANKTYTSSGSLNEIQIWNVSVAPGNHIESLSWNTRPERIALMGTVAFLTDEEKVKQLNLQDGWQSMLSTHVTCGNNETLSIEVACDRCTLEFEQLFSMPPMAFDLFQIG